MLAAVAVFSYYALIAIATNYKYEANIPNEIWLSLMWAELYLFAVMAFVTFFSSFMARTATAMISAFMVLLMVFGLLTMILSYSGVTTEPLYFLTYYSNIITQCFDMPTDRFVEAPFQRGPGADPDGDTYLTWLTPSVAGAFWGMFTYSAICLTAAYYLFKRRQNKAN